MGRIGVFLAVVMAAATSFPGVAVAKMNVVDKEIVFRSKTQVETWTFTSPRKLYLSNTTSGPSVTIKVYDANLDKLLFEETLEKGDKWKQTSKLPRKVRVELSCPDFVSGEKRVDIQLVKDT